MPKFIVVPALQSYPLPAGQNEKGEFETLEEATAAASESMKTTPTIARTIAQVVSRISGEVKVSVSVESESDK